MHPLICGRQARPGQAMAFSLRLSGSCGEFVCPAYLLPSFCICSIISSSRGKSQCKQRYSTLRARSPDLLSCCVFVFTIQAELRPPPPPPSPDVFSFLLLVYSSAERVIGVAASVVVFVSCCLAISAPIALQLFYSIRKALRMCSRMAQFLLSLHLGRRIIKTVIWSVQNVFKH